MLNIFLSGSTIFISDSSCNPAIIHFDYPAHAALFEIYVFLSSCSPRQFALVLGQFCFVLLTFM